MACGPAAPAPDSPATAPVTSAAPPEAAAFASDDDAALKRELKKAGIYTATWKTDFRRRSIPLTEITSGGPPRDGIPPIDQPRFVTTAEADEWLGPQEPVLRFDHDGDARAYPLQILTWHEIVNDEVGGIPVTVTFCPLCNSAITFDRRLEGMVYDFGTSGKLRHSDLIMWDRQTESWWQQLTGEAIVGELTGNRLTFLPSTIVSWKDFKEAHPDGKVLSRNTGFQRPYGENPYVGYDQVDLPPFLFEGPTDGRLPPKERVAAVTVGDLHVAFPYSILEEEPAVNYTAGGRDLVVFFQPGTQSALDRASIGQSREVGSTGVFDRHLDGKKLTFRFEAGRFVDRETGSHWTLLGEAVSGPLTGARLTPIVHGDYFWFAWGAFKPDTLVYQGQGKP